MNHLGLTGWILFSVKKVSTAGWFQRINGQTRVTAVLMPNTNAIGDEKWSAYRTSVDEIERHTGYDLLSNLPPAVQQALEAGTDKTVIQSVTLPGAQ